MIKNIILASRSEVRKQILEKNGITCKVIPAQINEDQVKDIIENLLTVRELLVN